MPKTLIRLAYFLAESFVMERGRWALWVPVLFAVGIGVYFALTVEPEWWIAPCAATLGLAISMVGRRTQKYLLVGVCVTTCALGFGAAQLRTVSQKHVVLDRPIGPTT